MSKYDLIRSEVNVTKKPFKPSQVYRTPYNILGDKIKQLLKELPVVDGIGLDFSEDGQGFFEEFLNGRQQFFIVKWNNKIFFVDTQGFNYARYVGEITNCDDIFN